MSEPTPKYTADADTKVCEAAQMMDYKYNTRPSSPLHHDNRWCPIHNKDHKPH